MAGHIDPIELLAQVDRVAQTHLRERFSDAKFLAARLKVTGLMIWYEGRDGVHREMRGPSNEELRALLRKAAMLPA